MTLPAETTSLHPAAKRLRIAGALLACSTPISGFVAFAIAAVALGEDRLEGSDGLTALGWAVMAIPLLTGVAMFCASFIGGRAPSSRVVGYGLVGIAGLFLVAGLSSLTTRPGDASIGGGLLVLAAMSLAVLAGWLLWFRAEQR